MFSIKKLNKTKHYSFARWLRKTKPKHQFYCWNLFEFILWLIGLWLKYNKVLSVCQLSPLVAFSSQKMTFKPIWSNISGFFSLRNYWYCKYLQQHLQFVVACNVWQSVVMQRRKPPHNVPHCCNIFIKNTMTWLACRNLNSWDGSREFHVPKTIYEVFKMFLSLITCHNILWLSPWFITDGNLYCACNYHELKCVYSGFLPFE